MTISGKMKYNDLKVLLPVLVQLIVAWMLILSDQNLIIMRVV